MKEALDILRGAVMIVYPMGLPPHDPIKMEFDNEEDLSGTQVGVAGSPDNGVTTSRDLYRIKLLLVTHVLVDTWMLTVKLVYTLSNVSDDLKWTTNTHATPFSLTLKA